MSAPIYEAWLSVPAYRPRGYLRITHATRNGTITICGRQIDGAGEKEFKPDSAYACGLCVRALQREAAKEGA